MTNLIENLILRRNKIIDLEISDIYMCRDSLTVHTLRIRNNVSIIKVYFFIHPSDE